VEPSSRRKDESELLRHFFENVALDDVAFLVFVKVSKFDAAFHSVADLFDIILKTAER
jgi:hypothetical protein